jgi:hypothetical protein
MTKAEARQTVKHHVKRRGEDELKVTDKLTRYWWNVLNTAVFDGKLNIPRKFIFRRFHQETLGYCVPLKRNGDVHLAIRSDLPSFSTFLTVLVHEMVHQWQWVNHKHIAHGPSFYKWKPIIEERVGLPLSRLVDID